MVKLRRGFVLTTRNVGGVEIFRSSQAHEDKVYARIKAAVFKQFSPGEYTDREFIISVVNLMYKKYYEILDEYLPKIVPGDFARYLICEYERYGKVEDVYKANGLSAKDEEFWVSYAGSARRAIKHLLELICISNLDESRIAPTLEEQEDAISMVFIAAEELVSLYLRSDRYLVFHDELELRLNPDVHVYFDVPQDSSLKFDIRESVRDTPKYVPSPTFLQDVQAHSKILDASFKETLGLSYIQTMQAIQWIINTFSEVHDPEVSGEFEWNEVVNTLAHAYHIEPSQAELILEGFSLSAKSMEARELFRSKQEYRAYKRAFFKYVADGEVKVYFSQRMAKESFALLVADVPFRNISSEWQSKCISKALDKLSLAAGRWFEDVVVQNLKDAGIVGSPSIETLIMSKEDRMRIPPNVGEIDFLGFQESQKLLIIIEIKQVKFSTEPKMVRDDIDKFTKGPSSYSAKFINKYNWAIENIDSIQKHFAHNFKLETKLEVAGYVMITHYATMASLNMRDFSCVPLSEFMNKVKDGQKWPFSKKLLNRPE